MCGTRQKNYILKINILQHIKRHPWRYSVILIAVVWFYFALPKTLFKVPYATALYDKNGELLGAKIATDGQWRFPLSDSLPDKYKQCVIAYEDAYFYSHPGVNPVSLVKALYQDVKAGKIVRGGSTLTMQVMRMARGNRSRNLYQKLMEIILALRLECSYSKEEILNLYASHAPFGGNVVGLEAAAWRYFGRSPSQLSWGETATLAVLPNAPALIYPGKNQKILRRKRNDLLDKLLKNNIIDSITCQLAKSESLPQKPHPLPRLAPHLLDKAVKDGHEGKRIYSSLDKHLQEKVLQTMREHYAYLSSNKIYNAGVLVADVETGQVLAYAGNMPEDVKPENQAVDMITARRSTGSILKPFLYAWAYKDGIILPRTLLKDIPTQIAGYHPRNYNKTYDGAVPASEALARSLNIPAVRLLRTYGLQKFRYQLKSLHLPTIDKPADYYGLTLILGGAETRLWDITSNYAAMARVLKHYNQSGAYNPSDYFGLSYLPVKRTFTPNSHDDLFGADNIWFVFKALSDKDRPVEGDDWNIYRSAQKIAWKTGTSFGHRDAWCIGVTPRYAVGVWVGNATGEGRPGMTGTRTAAPLMFDVYKHLPAGEWFERPDSALRQAKICRQSGYLASPRCTDPVIEYIPGNGERSPACPYHKIIHLNKEKTLRVNSSCYDIADMVNKSFFVLPPVMAWYYKQKHPDYQDLPPWAPGCQPAPEHTLDLIYPKNGIQVFIPKDFGEKQQKIVCKAVDQNPGAIVYWHLDNDFVKMTRKKHQIEIFAKPGKHRLTLVDDAGQRIVCRFEVVRK